MTSVRRRRFLKASAAAGSLLPELGFLAPLSRAAADVQINSSQVRLTPSIETLIRLIRATPGSVEHSAPLPIMAANTWGTLEALGWQHAALPTDPPAIRRTSR